MLLLSIIVISIIAFIVLAWRLKAIRNKRAVDKIKKTSSVEFINEYKKTRNKKKIIL